MVNTVVIPKLGQSMEDVTLVKWRKEEGDKVQLGDILFEVETEKAVLEVESFFSGVLLKILVQAGETVPVNTPVCFIGEPGDKLPDIPQRPLKKTEPVVEKKVTPAVSSSVSVSEMSTVPVVSQSVVSVPLQREPGRIFITPRARKLVRESCVDPVWIKGSGPNGRITEKDVKRYLEENGYYRIKITPSAKKMAMREKLDLFTLHKLAQMRGSSRIMVCDVERAIAERPRQLSRMRQTIARRLSESHITIPHFYVTVEVDITDLMSFRKKINTLGYDFSVTDFILKAVILSLEEYPVLNSSTDGTNFRWHSYINLGLAVAIDDGLVVPVIRNASKLTFLELHQAVESLVARARERKLLPEEMSGSTFTVSNMGMYDVESFTAIINPGEVGILAVATAYQVPRVINGKIKIRQVMKMTLSADHRLIDGKTSADFLRAIKNKLENVNLWEQILGLNACVKKVRGNKKGK